MKFTQYLVLVCGLLLANATHAQSPREQLQQMVEQLQQSPNDNALREKIIKLAPTLKPSPAVPDAAVAFGGRARFAFQHAKPDAEGDFLAAAQEYEKAIAAAPWVLNYYSDLCLSYEKAGKFKDAKRNCEFYLFGLSDPAEITNVKERIAGLEFGIEKANSQRAGQQAAQAHAESSIEGTWQRSEQTGSGRWIVNLFHVRHQPGDNWSISKGVVYDGQEHPAGDLGERNVQVVKSELRFTFERILGCGTYEVRGAVSADGRRLMLAYTLLPFPPNRSLDCPLEKFYGSHVDEYTKQ